MTRLSRREFVSLSAAAVAASGLSGCGDPQAVNDFAYARVFNALIGAPGMGDVDVVLSRDGVTHRSLSFGAATPYRRGSYGSTDVTFYAAGDRSAPLVSSRLDLLALQNNTFAVAGVVGGSGAQAPRIIRLTDPFAEGNAAPAGGEFRLVNLSPDSGAVDFYGGTEVTLPDETTTIEYRPVIGATGVTYGNASVYRVVPPTGGEGSPYAFAIGASNTGALFDLPSLQRGGQILVPDAYSFFLVGLAASGLGQQGRDAKVTLDERPPQ